MSPMTAILIGNESLLVQCADRLLARGHPIAAVVTRNAAVRDWAGARGLRIEAPGRDLADRLAGLSCDWLLSIANLDMIPPALRAIASRGAVNFHDGPLPRYAGLNAPVWALLNGETRHGITWHMIGDGVDDGDILEQRVFDIADTDTALTLNTRCYEAAIESFGAVIDALETGAPELRPQNLSQRSVYRRAERPAAAGRLDFTRPVAELARLVRALDHRPYLNPLTTPKIEAGGRVWLVGAAIPAGESHAAPGTVLEVTADALCVTCADGALRLDGLTCPQGLPVAPGNVARVGDVLPSLDAAEAGMLTAALARIAPAEGFWRRRLADQMPARIAGARTATGGETGTLEIALPDRLGSGRLLALIAAWAARMGQVDRCDIAFRDIGLTTAARPGYVSGWVPVRFDAQGKDSGAADFATFSAAFDAELARVRKAGAFAPDLIARDPEIEALTLPQIGLALGDNDGLIAGTALTVSVIEDGPHVRLHHDTARVPAELARLLARRLEAMAVAIQDPAAARLPFDELPILPEPERALVLDKWNDTATDYDRGACIHHLFEAQVARTPDAPALVFEHLTLSYAELNARANRAAHVLREMGVRPGTLVGLCARRSVEMMVGALAILKAGGAYLPLDPAYPANRLRHCIADSGAPVIVMHSELCPTLPEHEAALLKLDCDPRLATAAHANPEGGAGPRDLAYLIYTSGSTGTPKGVMVEHGNVVNFFAGMDARIAHEDGGTWLAVTSLSFDISVLELFYTLARGFKVVLTGESDRALVSGGSVPTSDRGMEFSLYYWGNDDGTGRDKYKTLLEGAKFADENGFCAVWTPERHFHAFGGPYPNPSVTGAAVAAVTRNLSVRAGSCVAPLHHPARIAEEWAVIDNLTNGRAGLAIASGWQPDDFVLRPENSPPDNKPAMLRDIEILRRLWAGDAVGFARKDGSLHEVVTQPRPVSKTLPVWVTTAGNPETWKEAGRIGANVLTHLLGQSVDEVAEKIGLYHAALREAGHDPADFTVTLMLHCCIAVTRDAAREIAREPMKDYLRSAAGLIKQYAWAFPAFRKPQGVKTPFELDLGSLTAEELEGILDFAFERYFNESGLFGTVEDALVRVEQLKRIGVDEVACLIDYGIAPEMVLDGLRPLAEVLRRANTATTLRDDDFSLAAQILRHDVTHLQCTPSMARMIATSDETRAALGRVRHILLGGEALPGALVAEFGRLTAARVENMYGPTETTIWSSTETADPVETVVNIGRPVANTRLYVLDAAQQPLPVGFEGELWIGGEGVTRGYWRREEMTAERFRPNPFHPGRMYRTGDLVRRRADGRIDFIGRVDHQVKLRGYRIEPGEIEAALEGLPGVTQAVVAAREDRPGDTRLVGYYTGTPQDESALRAALATSLPPHMVPPHFLHMHAFPLTPNKKIDRNALPPPRPPAEPRGVAASAFAHGSGIEDRLAGIWARVLGVQGASGRDNFFDLGGHSLLAVQAHRMIREELAAPSLSITDIFRFPVLSALAERVSELAATGPGGTTPPAQNAPAPASDRAQTRQDAMARRRAMRARRRA